jgi:large subunit ribosomal protein L22
VESVAKLKHLRISPRKVQIVLDLIRGKSFKQASAILKYTPKGACKSLEKLLNSAAANAINNLNMDENSLYVSECFVTPASMLKRIRAVSKGRSCRILKRMSHITIKMREIESQRG